MTRPRTGLDWHDRKHWGGRRLPCVLCGRGAFCRDDDGNPCHKTCAELALADPAHHSAPGHQGAPFVQDIAA
ncbi:hypothetical protein [Actinomadura montaniterrae]|uniref:Uncharacterized protein n=1 Tax=Actinomadura montaniterrae TaxID=1803903 RepID=A0A6L3VFK1_9ACTN|nr:hypothetical protein [Actinomadura montaniterrae]KAB2365210.1 hypothetical protein F9B16_40935 [Actinomadura montaniterrae]